jgi:hypothetical protein
MGVPQTQQGMVLNVTSVQALLINYKWVGLSGSSPTDYGNTVYLWQTSETAIPRNKTPENSHTIPGNHEDGSDSFETRMENEPYLLAYAVGPSVDACCASVWVPASGTDFQNFEPEVTATDVESNSVAFSYSLPPGMTPKSDGDWAGIWEANEGGILYSSPPMASTQIDYDGSSGEGALTGLDLLRDTTYTIGYFKTGWSKTKPTQTTLACFTTFST